METYVILRRGAWESAQELDEAAGRSGRIGNEEMPEDIRWIRSYVICEPDGGSRHGLRLSGERPRGDPRALPQGADDGG